MWLKNSLLHKQVLMKGNVGIHTGDECTQLTLKQSHLMSNKSQPGCPRMHRSFSPLSAFFPSFLFLLLMFLVFEGVFWHHFYSLKKSVFLILQRMHGFATWHPHPTTSSIKPKLNQCKQSVPARFLLWLLFLHIHIFVSFAFLTEDPE